VTSACERLWCFVDLVIIVVALLLRLESGQVDYLFVLSVSDIILSQFLFM